MKRCLKYLMNNGIKLIYRCSLIQFVFVPHINQGWGKVWKWKWIFRLFSNYMAQIHSTPGLD